MYTANIKIKSALASNMSSDRGQGVYLAGDPLNQHRCALTLYGVRGIADVTRRVATYVLSFVATDTPDQIYSDSYSARGDNTYHDTDTYYYLTVRDHLGCEYSYRVDVELQAE